MKAWRGFSLIELMIVVVILGVLLALAVPTFLDASLSSKLSSHANSLVTSVHLARSEAIKRNAIITMCVSTDGTSCAADDWHKGWIVMCPTTDGLACDPAGADEIIFNRQQALPSGFRITEASALDTLTFQPTGVGVTTATLTVCRSAPSVGSQERVLSISATGRPSISTTETGSCP